MTDTSKIQKEAHNVEKYEDEIELTDILRVIWKWKYLIITGTIICGLIAALISLNMRKIYRIEMILRPGILSVGEQGKKVYIDSPQNIKALIDSGTFNNDFVNYLNEIKMENIPKNISFKVTIPANSVMIKVVYETGDVKQGMVIQNYLSKLLLANYVNTVAYYRNESDMKLKSLKSELKYIKATILSQKRNVKNLEKRIDELNAEGKSIKNNTTNLLRERNKLLSENSKEKNILSKLVYSNTIQQNLQLSKNYQNDINNYKQQKEDELQKIIKSENDMANKFNEIKDVQFKKEIIQNIQILQPPTSNPNPIKPKIKLNVALVLVAGSFFFIFLSFFLEYLKKFKKIH
jgi:uncharacterized protein involved in exopolysaccharide biosynthesis